MERTMCKQIVRHEKKGPVQNEYVLKTNKLSKTFAKTFAVKDVSISVRGNSVYGLLGPNGAGKSTLLKMITGIMNPTSGEILFKNHPWKRTDLLDICSLIESPPLYENLTAYENLKVRALLLGIREEKCDEVLQSMDLMVSRNKKVCNFSMGMKQRLGIALALINDPELLILDEPANGLDPFGIEELREMMRIFADSGISVIVSSHILSEVQKFADDIGILYEGSLLYQGKNDTHENLEQLFMDIIREKEVYNAADIPKSRMFKI